MQIIPLPSLYLPLCKYISILLCIMYLPAIHIYPWCTVQCFYPKFLFIFSFYLLVNTFHISSVFICLQSFLLVNLQYLMCLFFYSVHQSILQHLSICNKKLSSVHLYPKMSVYQQFLSFLLCISTVYEYIQ